MRDKTAEFSMELGGVIYLPSLSKYELCVEYLNSLCGLKGPCILTRSLASFQWFILLSRRVLGAQNI